MKNNTKLIAVLMVLVMSVVTLSSCAGGRTIEDAPGDASAVVVEGKDEVRDVPYTGDPIIETVEIPGKVIEQLASELGGNDDGGNDDGGNDDGGNDDGGNEGGNDEGGNEGGGDDDGGDTDIEWTEDSLIPEYSEEDILSILCQNVRCMDDTKPSQGNPGYPGTSLAERHLRIKDEVEKTDPDLMGFQEVRRDWEKLLIGDYKSDYDYYYCYRYSGTDVAQDAGDECSAVFWKKDRFEKLDTGEFWLSSTPDSPSKFSDQEDQFRVCNWVKLKNKETGKKFVFASVHYSTDPKGRLKSAAVMNAQLKKVAGNLPIIAVGDYNSPYGSEEYNALVMGGVINDINVELGSYFEDRDFDRHSTSGGYKTPKFDANGEAFGSIIDYIMISYDQTGLYPLSYEVLQKKYGGDYVEDGYVSDHFGLLGKVVIPS